jgi:hypothetical protein
MVIGTAEPSCSTTTLAKGYFFGREKRISHDQSRLCAVDLSATAVLG